MTKPSTAEHDAQASCVEQGVGIGWETRLSWIQEQLLRNGCHPARAVVLVPYAQMMDAGRRAWAQQQAGGFPPRFESTRNWATSLEPFLPGPTDVSGDMARDSLIAAGLLDRVAGRGMDASLRDTLVGRVVEAAQQLAPLAAARPPAERAAWAEALRPALTPDGRNLQWEGLVASLALTWAGLSAYATDVLWSERAAPGLVADVLLVLPGFQNDPLALALVSRWGERAALLDASALAEPVAQKPLAALHVCGDAEDEAQRAAACVIERVNAGQVPVALVAQDRLLTRRIGALLHGAGLSVRDETGWKLSTTHAAARLMSLLRAADRRARTDDVLDWLKQGPHAAAVDVLEQQTRRLGLAQWRQAATHPLTQPCVPVGAAQALTALQPARPLVQWLTDLAGALREDGWWALASRDPAGQRVIEVLRLQEGAGHELAGLGAETIAAETGQTATGRRWSLPAFCAWVRAALEAASFLPGSEGTAVVVVLPMAQLLGRGFAATVAPGCDDIHLPPSPEPPGHWSEAQRALLGLPGREALARAAHAAWQHLLMQPGLQVLWRTEHQGETVGAAPWVLALRGQEGAAAAADPRVPRSVNVAPEQAPQPVAADLLPLALSASAYQDLRDCPYRFFALRQLRLQPVDEIEAEPDKRDLGNWLHAVLKAFHEARAQAPVDGLDDRLSDRERLDALAQAEAQARGLAVDGSGEGAAGFLPFMAAWPALREGYLAWLAGHEAGGPRFERAEVSLQRALGPWRLVGQIDREDRQASPEGPLPLVIDYKTEPRQTTLDRVKQPLEDTQIAFYAALLGDDTVRGAYLSITDKRETEGRDAATTLIEQTDIEVAREHLLAGISSDLGRIAAGHPLPALGEGKVCDFCAARGLCRKDFKA